MKKLLLLMCVLLTGVSGAWADGTWASGNTADQANGQLSTIGWIKIKTPAGESGIKFTSFTFKHMGSNQKAARLAFSANKLGTATALPASNFAGISSNMSTTSSPNTPTYTFDGDGVTLYGNSWYYVYFLTDNADGETYDLSTNGVAVQTGLSLTGDEVFHYAGKVTDSESTNSTWKPYYTCSYTSVDLSTVTVTYSCENMSGYTLVTSTNSVIESGTKFTPPAAPAGYTLDGVYDDTDATFDYANTNISEDKTLKLKYHLTTNPLENNKSTVASPVWYTFKYGTGSGVIYMKSDGDIVRLSNTDMTISYPLLDNYLWCFEGDETTGYVIYNKAAEKYVGKGEAESGTYYLTLLEDDPIKGNHRWTLIYQNGHYYLYSITETEKPHVNRASQRPHFYTSGMTYYEGATFENALTLYQTNYPYSTIVNTAGYVGGYESAEVAAAQTAVSSTEPTTVDAYASFVTPLGSKIALEAGYYRFVSALSGFEEEQGVKKDLTIDTSYPSYPGWETYNTNSAKQIYYLSGGPTTWYLQNVSNGKYIVVPAEQNGWIQFGNSGSSLTLWDFGSSMYAIGTTTDLALYAYGNSNGTGNSEMLTAYTYNYYASLWYLEKVSLPTITMISPSAVDAESDVYMSYANNTGANKQVPAGVTVYKVEDGSSKADVALTEVTSKVVPDGKGVILKAKKGATIPLLPTSTAESLSGNMLEAGDGTAQNGYLLAYKNGEDVPKFYVMEELELPNNKAYLPSGYFPASVKELSIIFNDQTAINAIENEAPVVNDAIYNMAGQRISRLQKGVNIVNGKKVLVK